VDIRVECVTPDGLSGKKRVWFRGIFHLIGNHFDNGMRQTRHRVLVEFASKFKFWRSNGSRQANSRSNRAASFSEAVSMIAKELRMKILMKNPSAFLPVMMSLGALATVGLFIALHGTAPQADEGAAAHIWQLLMAAQLPIVLFFAIKWLPQSPRQAVPILALQVGAALAAMAPVYLLHW